MLTRNEWIFSGEIFYLKELDGEFAVSLKIKGTAKRRNAMSSYVAEFSCIGDAEFKREMERRGVKLYSLAMIAGHCETWFSDNRQKNMFIADSILEFKNKP